MLTHLTHVTPLTAPDASQKSAAGGTCRPASAHTPAHVQGQPSAACDRSNAKSTRSAHVQVQDARTPSSEQDRAFDRSKTKKAGPATHVQGQAPTSCERSNGKNAQGAHVQGQRWTRRGPLPLEVREHLAAGFGAKIRAHRKARGWTQAQLATEIGRALNTVQRLETGQHRPTVEVMIRLAVAFVPDGNPLPLAAELAALAGAHVRMDRRHRAMPLDNARAVLATLQRRIGQLTRQRDRAAQLARDATALRARIDRARATTPRPPGPLQHVNGPASVPLSDGHRPEGATS